MASDIAALPREPDILIEMVLELRGENGKLRAMLETLRRTLYGARSERFGDDPGQLALGLEDVSTTPAEPEPDPAKPRSQDGRTRPKPVRNIGSLPKHLPREDVVIEPVSDRCPCCQGTLHCIGDRPATFAHHRSAQPRDQTPNFRATSPWPKGCKPPCGRPAARVRFQRHAQAHTFMVLTNSLQLDGGE